MMEGDGINPSFSVIATSYNDTAIIEQYITNLSKQTLKANEYILVDGGSSDDTVQRAETVGARLGMPIKVYSGERLNIAQGYNRGIEKASYDVIIITGIGNEYDEHFFECLLEEYSKTNSRIVYGRTIGQDNGVFSKAYNSAFLGGEKGVIPSLPSNRGVLIEKNVFTMVGMFYEKFVYAGEDTEFFHRTQKNGIDVGITNDAVLYWETPKNMKEFLKQREVYYIGKMQHTGTTKSDLFAYVILLAIIFASALTVFLGIHYFFGAIVLFLAVGCFHYKTINVIAPILRLLDKVLPCYYLLTKIKFSKSPYKMEKI